MGAWGHESLANDYGSDLRIEILEELGLYPKDDDDMDCCDEDNHCEYHDWLYSYSCILPNQILIDKFKNDILPDKLKDILKSPVACFEAHCLALFVLENKIKLDKTTNKQIIVTIDSDDLRNWSYPLDREAINNKIVRELIKLQKS